MGEAGMGQGLPKRLIDIQAASAYTGLAVKTIYKMIQQRKIPHVKVGRLVKFDLTALDKWIISQSVMPM